VPARPQEGYRSYGAEDASRLRFVRKAQSLGFTLREVLALLRIEAANCADAERLAAERLASVRARIAGLRRLEKTLDDTVQLCREGRDPGCPLIASLFGP